MILWRRIALECSPNRVVATGAKICPPLGRNLHSGYDFDFIAPPQKQFRRVVVTGIGMVTPFGFGVADTWNALLSGKTSIRGLRRDDLPDGHQEAFEQLPSKVVGMVEKTLCQERYDAADIIHNKLPKFVHFAQLAANEAIKDAGWLPVEQQDKERTGVAIGAGMSCTYEMGMSGALVLSGKIRRLSPFFVPRILVNAAAGAVSMDYGFQGPNHAVSTACATGAHSIGDAFRMIQRGDADVMIAGGTESCVDAISLGGFSRLKALSTSHNDSPDRASRPFDAKRDGFVLSEGAAVLVLEEAEHALARRAPSIYCEIMGYGMSGDAFHVTQPRSDGFGAKLAMNRALDGAGLTPSSISYINAHATSTLLGDKAELAAIDSLFNSSEREMPMYVSSLKGALGHLLGAAGAVEAAISALTCYHHVAPPTANLVKTDIETKSALIQESPQLFEMEKLAVLSNSFGFGGTNTSLVFAGARIN